MDVLTIAVSATLGVVMGIAIAVMLAASVRGVAALLATLLIGIAAGYALATRPHPATAPSASGAKDECAIPHCLVI